MPFILSRETKFMNFLYALLIPVREDVEIEVGKLGKIRFSRGCYVYIGSANSGLWRIRRHFRRGKAMRWHVDRLTEMVKPLRAYAGYFKLTECELAKRIAAMGEFFAKGFGASDSRCFSHLVRFEGCDKALEAVSKMGFITVLDSAGVR